MLFVHRWIVLGGQILIQHSSSFASGVFVEFVLGASLPSSCNDGSIRLAASIFLALIMSVLRLKDLYVDLLQVVHDESRPGLPWYCIVVQGLFSGCAPLTVTAFNVPVFRCVACDLF